MPRHSPHHAELELGGFGHHALMPGRIPDEFDGNVVDAFEAQLRRMVGAEDGVTDALFQFTRPVTGAYFWCPPMRNGRLDLRAVGL